MTNTTTTRTTTAAQDIAEMLRAWNIIESTARAQFPAASEETIYRLTSGAMKAQLCLHYQKDYSQG